MLVSTAKRESVSVCPLARFKGHGAPQAGGENRERGGLGGDFTDKITLSASDYEVF